MLNRVRPLGSALWRAGSTLMIHSGVFSRPSVISRMARVFVVGDGIGNWPRAVRRPLPIVVEPPGVIPPTKPAVAGGLGPIRSILVDVPIPTPPSAKSLRGLGVNETK